MRAFLIVVVVTACGSVSNTKMDGPGSACTPETDAEFCTRLAKTCDSFTGMDNCNQPRTAACGTCSGAMPVCASNVCVAPECGTTFSNVAGVPVSGLNMMSKQSALLGASSAGGSVLYLQPTAGACVPTGSSVVIADEATPGTPPYVLQTIGAQAALAGFARSEETMTLTGDGLTIIGVATAGNAFLSSKRSAVGMTDFATAAVGPFAFVNAGIPAGSELSFPVLSKDGLEFTFRVAAATDPTKNGIYDSVRPTTNDTFPAATKLNGFIQTYESITGLSGDRLTAFVGMSFATHIVTRASLTADFLVPASTTPPFQAYRIVPIASCATLMGTTEPGGCANEQIATWAKQ